MKQVKHDNILPVYGVSSSLAPDFCLIFPWYKNGNIMEYLKGNRNANRFDLASSHIQVYKCSRRSLEFHEQLLGAVNGLRYLHDARLVHGALQPVPRLCSCPVVSNAASRVIF
jgi:serine/threonine protein kinase